MRTKTLLLAAAALASGLISSQAQTVYSQNIVGYVNQSFQANKYSMCVVPFAIGVSNGANEIFGSSLGDGTQIYTWDPVHGKYVINTYDTGDGYNLVANGGSGPWLMADDATVTNPPVLSPGQGFFLYGSSAVFPAGGAAGASYVTQSSVTNSYAGAVACLTGGSVTNSVPANSYAMLGSVIPFGDSVTNPATLNLTGLTDGTQIYAWNGSTYVIYTYDTGDGYNLVANGGAGPWLMSDDATPTNAPAFTVGQGVFIYGTSVLFPPGGAAGASYTTVSKVPWIESLPSN